MIGWTYNCEYLVLVHLILSNRYYKQCNYTIPQHQGHETLRLWRWLPDLKMAWWQEVENTLRFLITPFLLGYLTSVGDHRLLPWLAIVSPSAPFYGVHGIHSLDHPAEDNMLPIQPTKLPFQELQLPSQSLVRRGVQHNSPACLDSSYVKLRSIRIKSRIRHSNNPCKTAKQG